MLYYLHKDHLGSIMQITNQSGAVVENRSYDVWGSPRDLQTGEPLSNLKWLVGKGYTGHEHLMEFRLVNMQGRLYDPVICRFLSPDPYVQEPDNSQNLNRYSYCFNNPLAYIDPSGEWIFEDGDYYTQDSNDIARLLNFLNAFGAGSFSASAIREFAATEIITGGQSAFYRYSEENQFGQRGGGYAFLPGITVYRSILGQFTVDKSSFQRMIAARNKIMDGFSGVGSIPAGQGGRDLLCSNTTVYESKITIGDPYIGVYTIKLYQSSTKGSGPINTSINQRMETNVSLTIPLKLINPKLSTDGVMIEGPKFGIPFFPTLYTGFSVSDGVTIGGEYADRNGVTHGLSNSIKLGPVAGAMIGIGVFFTTGIPFFAF